MSQQAIRYIFKVGVKGIYCRPSVFPCVISSSFFVYPILNRNMILFKQVTTQSVGLEREGVVAKIGQKVKFIIMKYKLRAAGFYLYEKIADELDYDGYMEELKMPDTLQSWFLITELHVWMIMVRLMAEQVNGRFVRNCLVEALWQDVTNRTKKLGVEHLQAVRYQLQEMSEQFQAALVSYDEGLLSGDTVLAGAVWWRLLEKRNDPESLEAIVQYIRKTMHLFDRMDTYDFIQKRNFQWPPVEKVFAKST